MIYFWCRLGMVLIANGIKPKWNLNEDVSLKCRVRLLDCDGLQVMCGFQDPMYMDLGRWVYITRAGFVTLAIKNNWAPVLRSQKIFYLKPLRLWSSFNVKVSLAGVDNKWFYHLHLFEQNNSTKAIGITKAGVWKERKKIPVDDVLDDPRVICKQRALPEWIRELFHKHNEVTRELLSLYPERRRKEEKE